VTAARAMRARRISLRDFCSAGRSRARAVTGKIFARGAAVQVRAEDREPVRSVVDNIAKICI
jgi:hypothetical protein